MLQCTGSDIEAMFPHLEKRECGDIVRDFTKTCGLNFPGTNIDEALLLIRQNLHMLSDIDHIKPFLPTRAKTRGPEPGMNCRTVRGPKLMSEIAPEDAQWVPKPTPQDPELIRDILGCTLSIEIQAFMSH